jgi:hypothetical protein
VWWMNRMPPVHWKFSWELKTIYCWWFSWGCCREFSPLSFKGDWNGERVGPGIETLGKTLVFATTTVLQDDEKEILVSELKLPFVPLQKPCFFNACSRVYNDSCKVLIVLVHFVCSVIAGLLRLKVSWLCFGPKCSYLSRLWSMCTAWDGNLQTCMTSVTYL